MQNRDGYLETFERHTLKAKRSSTIKKHDFPESNTVSVSA